MPYVCVYPFATRQTLNRSTLPYALCLTEKIHLHPSVCFPGWRSVMTYVLFFSRALISSKATTFRLGSCRAASIVEGICTWSKLETKARYASDKCSRDTKLHIRCCVQVLTLFLNAMGLSSWTICSITGESYSRSALPWDFSIEFGFEEEPIACWICSSYCWCCWVSLWDWERLE